MTIQVDVRDGGTAYLPQVADGRYELVPQPGGGWMFNPLPPSRFPYRIVDARGRGWLLQGAGEEDPEYSVFPRLDGEPGIETWVYSRIRAERGAAVPVTSVAPRADRERLEGLLAYAGKKAAGTLMFALHGLRGECHRCDGDPLRMVAGRPGSGESADLLQLTQACVPAEETDLRPAEILEEDKPEPVTVEVYKVLYRWVLGPGPFVEVAANVAGIFGRVIDGRGGWNEVTTTWVRRGGAHAVPAEKLLRDRTRYHRRRSW